MSAIFSQIGVVLLVVIGVVLWRRHRAHAALDGAARVLDGLAVVLRRAVRAEPFLRGVARETGGSLGRASLRVADGLEAGYSLADAMEAGGGRYFGGQTAASVRAVEGTAQVPAALEARVRELGHDSLKRHRLLLELIYPTMLAVALFAVLGSVAWVQEQAFEMYEVHAEVVDLTFFAADFRGPGALLFGCVAAVVVVAVGGWLLVWVLQSVYLLPGQVKVERIRMLSTCGLLLKTGMALPHALRRAASVSGCRRVMQGALDAAAALEEGDPVAEVWPRLGLPSAASARLAQSRGLQLALVTEDVAWREGERQQRRRDRQIRAIYPAALLLFGLGCLVCYTVLVQVWGGTLGEARPW